MKTNDKLKKNIGGFFTDFKKFISKGNIIDLAVAVVIGSAFTKIVNSLVADIIMPLIGLFIGTSDLGSYRWHITRDVYLNWGNVVLAIIDFLIVAFCIFTVLKIIANTRMGVTKLTKKQKKNLEQQEQKQQPENENTETEKPPVIENTDDILRDIRELLKDKK